MTFPVLGVTFHYRAWWGWKNVGATLAVALNHTALDPIVIFHHPIALPTSGSTFL
jgi:hypothetical protein